MTRSQLQLLHVAARDRGLIGPAGDGPWRLLLRNTGHVSSSKDLTNQTFEAVMALLEDLGYRHPGKSESHFRDKVCERNRYASSQAVWYLRKLAQENPLRYPLESLCLRLSGHRTDDPSQLTPGECYNVTEAVKQIAARTSASQPTLFPMPQTPVASPAPPQPVPSPKNAEDDNDIPF